MPGQVDCSTPMSTASFLGSKLYLLQLPHACLGEDFKFLTVDHDKHGLTLKKFRASIARNTSAQLKNLSNTTEQESSSKNVISPCACQANLLTTKGSFMKPDQMTT